MDDLAISKNSIHPEQTEIIMYQTEDGLTKIDVRMENETVWLTQAQMAELFQRERSGITKHIKNVFAEGEVDEKSNVKNVHIANSDKPVAYYSLDVIISVGYRVKSLRGTQFRIWANSVLKEYLIKGFAMNDELLKQAGGGNYFDELMDRIRDIRSSEKVFWRKVLDIYDTSVDYDPIMIIYIVKGGMTMLNLFVVDAASREKIPATVKTATEQDMAVTKDWQTDWTTPYASQLPNKVSLHRSDNDELLGLMSYEMDEDGLAVEIIYLENASHSNANLLHAEKKVKKYIGIARALFAYAVQISLNAGYDGVLIFKAKTSELLAYYTEAFGARQVASYDPFRLVIWEDAAADIIADYLEGGVDDGSEKI